MKLGEVRVEFLLHLSAFNRLPIERNFDPQLSIWCQLWQIYFPALTWLVCPTKIFYILLVDRVIFVSWFQRLFSQQNTLNPTFLGLFEISQLAIQKLFNSRLKPTKYWSTQRTMFQYISHFLYIWRRWCWDVDKTS